MDGRPILEEIIRTLKKIKSAGPNNLAIEMLLTSGDSETWKQTKITNHSTTLENYQKHLHFI